jgi:hypothetical protein
VVNDKHCMLFPPFFIRILKLHPHFYPTCSPCLQSFSALRPSSAGLFLGIVSEVLPVLTTTMKLRHIFSNQSEQQTPHRERKYLSLIESPLEVEEKNPRTHAGERHQLNVQQSSKAENAPDTGTPLEYSDTINGNGSAKLDNQVAPLPPTSSQPNNPLQWSNNIDGGDGSTQQDEKPHESRREQRREQQPHFRAHHEASSIELFYDLFFVANLATFTTNYPIDGKACK